MTKKSMWVIILAVISLMILIGGYVSPLPEKQLSLEETIPPETEAKTLFLENFESVIQNWSLEEGWYLERIGNNTVLKGRGHKWSRLENRGWVNYAFKAKFKLIQGTIHFNYRHSELEDGPHRYFIGVSSDVLYLNKQIGNKFYDLAEASIKLDNGWHEIEIRGYEDIINIYVDDNIHIFYKDDDPILSGSIAFETLEDSEFLTDDVEIRETLPSDIVTELGLVRIHNASKSGTLMRDEIWSGEIYIVDHVLVPNGITLVVEPGTVVKVKTYRGYKNPEGCLSICVEGTIIVNGTPNHPVRFTSDSSEPINGDWRGLVLVNSDDNMIRYAIVEFGKQGINGYMSDVIISNCIVRWNNWEGIYFENQCRPTITRNRIYENGYHGIALEQYNDANISYNTIRGNNEGGIVVLGSIAHLSNNVITDNKEFGVLLEQMVGVGGYIDGNDNIIAGNGAGQILSGKGTTGSTNMLKDTYSDVSEFEISYDYPDIREYELGYVPGDENDKYMYIYPKEDETRRVISKIGQPGEFLWSITWDGENIWAADLDGRGIYKFDPDTGEILKTIRVEGCYRLWGLAWDGEYMWAVDFEKCKIYKVDSVNGDVLLTLNCPDTGSCQGLTYDTSHLYTIGRSTGLLYAIDPESGKVVKEIKFTGHGGLTYDGKYFWAPTGVNKIGKFNDRGDLVGWIYAASEGTWDLAWDGNHLWATQRTNENWQDPKIYKIEIIDDSLK